jgi:ATPase subunit of ABC transporter with duplicated ATPase domains
MNQQIIWTLKVLQVSERALRIYKGALILVSHDATFLQNIGVEDEIKLI